MEQSRKLVLEPRLLHAREPCISERVPGEAHAVPVQSMAAVAVRQQAICSLKSCAIYELATFEAAISAAALRELPLHQEGAARHAGLAGVLRHGPPLRVGRAPRAAKAGQEAS